MSTTQDPKASDGDHAVAVGRRAFRPRAVITTCFFICLAVALTGCSRQLMPTPNLYAGAADDPFADVAPAYRTPEMDLVYATDRVPEPQKGDFRYGSDRSHCSIRRVKESHFLDANGLIADRLLGSLRSRLLGSLRSRHLGQSRRSRRHRQIR